LNKFRTSTAISGCRCEKISGKSVQREVRRDGVAKSQSDAWPEEKQRRLIAVREGGALDIEPDASKDFPLSEQDLVLQGSPRVKHVGTIAV
jgi:hypothetical protein